MHTRVEEQLIILTKQMAKMEKSDDKEIRDVTE